MYGARRNKDEVRTIPKIMFSQKRELYSLFVIFCLCMIPTDIPISKNIVVKPMKR